MDLILLALHAAEIIVLTAIFWRLRPVPPPVPPRPPVMAVEAVEAVEVAPGPEPIPATLPMVAEPAPVVVEEVTCAHGGRHGRHAETGVLLCRECIAAGKSR